MGIISFSSRGLTDGRELAKDWCDLAARADGGFFLSWDWIGCWLECIDTDVTLVEGRADGRIVALGLLCSAKRNGFGGRDGTAVYLHQTGDPAADRIAIEYNGFLLDRAVAKEGASQALSALVADGGLEWDSLFLRGLSQEFADAIVAGNYPARLRSRSPTAQVDLAALRATGQEFLERCSANTRAQVRRAIRQYEARGELRLEAASTVPQAQEFLGELGVLHQRYWADRGGDGAFSSDFFATFHKRLIEICHPKGRAELLRLSAGDTAIAYLYNFIDGKTVHYYSSGFLYEDDNRLKPGLVAHALCIERHLAAGRDRYDFMAGEARYKTSLGEPGPDILAYVLERPTAGQSVKDALRWVRDLAGRKS